jgi:hypothetical protein
MNSWLLPGWVPSSGEGEVAALWHNGVKWGLFREHDARTGRRWSIRRRIANGWSDPVAVGHTRRTALARFAAL